MRTLTVMLALLCASCSTEAAPYRPSHLDELAEISPGPEVRLGAVPGASGLVQLAGGATGDVQIRVGDEEPVTIPVPRGRVTKIAASYWNGSGIAVAIETAEPERQYWGVATGSDLSGLELTEIEGVGDVDLAHVWNPHGDSIHVLLVEPESRRPRYVFTHRCPTPEAPEDLHTLYDLGP